VSAQALKGQILRWPVEKYSRSFRVFVVEPAAFDPKKHAAIFNGALTALMRPEAMPADPYRTQRNVPVAEPFDLVTFPEAFLAAKDLTQALKQIAEFGRLGCVHVGLRSSEDPNTHLLGVTEFESLIADLSTIASIARDDLIPLKAWLGSQSGDGRFNVGCLFSIDSNGSLRVCLHPKMVRSKFEVGVVADDYMTAGSLLSLITLLPDSKKHLSVTLQPIICSDALQLDAEEPGRLPLNCVNSDDANVFDDTLPDHIDIVSVAACTPQPEGHENETAYRVWHQDFRKTFEQVGNGGAWHRHFHATFVLANFLTIPTKAGAPLHKSYGGLSGGFIPMPFGEEELPDFARLSAYGKDKEGNPDNHWSIPARKLEASFSSRGYVAHLYPDGDKTIVAKMLGFTITALPRDTPHWRPTAAFARFEVQTGSLDESGKVVTYTKGGA
jgi:hypothetical protein